MSLFSRIDAHSRRLDAMSRALGVDFDERLQRGVQTPEELRAYFARCLTCSDGAACDAWLAGEGRDHPNEAPGFCRNRDGFAGIMG